MKKILLLIIMLTTSLTGSAFAATATFAGGCFWCMQEAFANTHGVITTTVGYTDGSAVHPSYRQVSSGKTRHVEALQVTYNPQKIMYSQLLNVFWKNIDPTDNKGQFCDRGRQYRAVIFYHNTRQKQLASQSKSQLINSKLLGRVVTPILPATSFYPAEKYHQNYYKKNSFRYKFYKSRCGRTKRLNQLWKS